MGPSSPLGVITPQTSMFANREAVLNKYETTRKPLKKTAQELADPSRFPGYRSSAADILLGPKNTQGVRPGRKAFGGKTGAGLGAVETLLSGDPLAAAVSAPVGLGAGQIANVATQALTKGLISSPNPYMKLAGAGLRFVVPGAVGYAAQQTTAGGVQALAGTAPQAAQQLAGGVTSDGLGTVGGGGLSELTLPFIGPIGATAKARKKSEFEREQRQKDAQLELDLARQQGEIQTQQYLAQMQGLAPLIEQQDRRRFTQQQALINTQGRIYQNIGRMAGMFQLAGQNVQEAGAFARTALAANPYAGSTIQAPQITFGR